MRLRCITNLDSSSPRAVHSITKVESRPRIMQENFRNLILELFQVEAVKFGDFTLKSGILSPVYFDLRVIVSYPKLMTTVSELLSQAAKDNNAQYQSVCGVPYTALPLATVIACKDDIPMLIRRKEAKGYGTKKLIEGSYQAGDKCLIIEDVVTTGSSVSETVEVLNAVGLKVTDAVVLLNREQGGEERLKQEGINLYSVFTLTQVIDTLYEAGKVDSVMVERVRNFIKDNQCPPPSTGQTDSKPKVLTYRERADLCRHVVTKRLFTIMDDKKTNLALSADVTTSAQLIDLAESLGPHICLLKTHIDILQDFSQDVINKLTSIAQTHNFLLFEDRKFADIGKTVRDQYGGGMYRIADWSDITNAHILPGPGVVDGLKQAVNGRDRGCLLIAEMSSEGNLLSNDYAKAAVSMAEENQDFVIGFISQHKLSNLPSLVHMTPGVQLQEGGDGLGQQYITPDVVITQRHSDVIIVGRGITSSPDPVRVAKSYREVAFNAYLARLEASNQ